MSKKEKNTAEPIPTVKREAKSNHHFLSHLFSQAPMAVCILKGPHFIIEVINERMLEIIGRNQETVIDRPLFDALPEIVGQGYEGILDKVYNGGERFTADEMPVRMMKNGQIQTVYVKFICEPLFEEGKVSGVVAIADEVTELVSTRQRIKENEIEFKQLVETLPFGMYSCDKEGRITFYNDVAAEMWGYKPLLNNDQYRYCVCYKIWDLEGELILPTESPMAIAIQTGKSFRNLEAFIERPDGKRFYGSFNIEPVFDSNKNVKGAINLFQDISDRKAFEISLRESEKKYRSLIQSLPAAIYTTDINGYLTLYNEAAENLWGRKPQIGIDMWHDSWKIYKADGITSLSPDECPMAIVLKEGKKVTEELIVERPDGTRHTILPYPEPIYNSNGVLIGAVNMLVDITQKRIEEERLTRFEAIVQSSEDAIISKNLDGIIKSWNPAAEKLFGYTEAEMINQPIIRLIPEDRISEEFTILDNIRNGCKVENFETKRITKSGKLIDISITISPIKNARGEIIGASKIAHDITERKALNEALLKSEERLRMASEVTKLGAWEFHPQSKKMIWSAETKAIYGFSDTWEPENDIVVEHTFPADREFAAREVMKVMDPENKDAFKLEYRIIRNTDKQVRWVRAQGKVFFDENKTPFRFIGTMLDITEEKEALKARAENEARLIMAVQTARLGTWEYDTTTRRFYCSDESRSICGLPDSFKQGFEIINECIHEEDKEYFLQRINQALDPAIGKFDMQVRIHRVDNKGIRWIRASGKVFFDEGNTPLRLIGTMLDITREKLQEQELKESVELFQTMADNVPAMIWMSGEDKFNDYFNKTWLQFTGRSPEEESDEGWLEGVHPDDREKCVTAYNDAILSQQDFYMEYRLRRYDGEYRWISDKSVPRYSPDGEFLGFISACMDIDDQKRFREKLLASELLFKTIANTPPVGLWMTDTNGQNVFVNDTWIEWTGMPAEEQRGVGWLTKVLEEDKRDAPDRFREAMERKEKYSAEFRMLRNDGEIRWCLTEGYPYHDINGGFAGYAGSVTDITEIKRLEQRKDDFIKMASHELKTPVTTIKGYVQLLLKMFTSGKEPFLTDSLLTIDKQVSKLSKLIADLLDATKIETGQLKVNKEVFRLNEVINDIVKDVRTISLTHSVVCNLHADPIVYGDKDRIAQVVNNLLNNAIKYSPNASSVIIEIKADEEETIISVKDYGIGISSENHDRIFDRFFRVSTDKKENTFPGFGIGLFIVKEIITLHDGKVWVESQEGKGSLFSVSLPVFSDTKKS